MSGIAALIAIVVIVVLLVRFLFTPAFWVLLGALTFIYLWIGS